MPHHLRYQSQDWATHHITSRCIQGFSFLKPTSEIREVAGEYFLGAVRVCEGKKRNRGLLGLPRDARSRSSQLQFQASLPRPHPCQVRFREVLSCKEQGEPR